MRKTIEAIKMISSLAVASFMRFVVCVCVGSFLSLFPSAKLVVKFTGVRDASKLLFCCALLYQKGEKLRIGNVVCNNSE